MLRFLTAGESHGESLVAILDGMPAGLAPVDARRSTGSCTAASSVTAGAGGWRSSRTASRFSPASATG